MNKTTIEWVKNPDGSQGYTWNPITGCFGTCDYCYARKLAKGRLKEKYMRRGGVPSMTPAIKLEPEQPGPFYPRFWSGKLYQPLRVRRPCGIFTCDMSDLFGIGIPEYWTRQVLQVIKNAPHHRFYLLTKQPQNLAKWSPFPPNAWVGVTATNRDMLRSAVSVLYQVEAKIKYISLEPLLDWQIGSTKELRNLIALVDWVIIGSVTKHPDLPKPEFWWIREIVNAGVEAGISVFLKNNLFDILPFCYPPRQEIPDG